MFKKILSLYFSFLVISILSLIIYKQIVLQNNVAGISTSSEKNIIKGLIIPHHELAKEYTITSLDKITQNQIFSTIVIIGPNHFEEDERRFVSSDDLENYTLVKDVIYKLEKANLLTLKNETVEKEHSITVPANYLQKYFPNAELIPVLIPWTFDKNKINQIAIFLKSSLPEDTLFVASVDFAHNKMLTEAMENNSETIAAISSFDYEKIYQFDDSHTDSPASLGLLLQVMQRLGATNWETWYNSHGALIENTPDLQGTSYIIGVFTR